MGFFSKIKDNIKHGGVKVSVQTPTTLQEKTTVPVTVTVSTTETKVVNKVSVELQMEVRDRNNVSFGNADQSNRQNNEDYFTQIAQAEDNQTFTLNAGESKTVNLTLVIPEGATHQKLSERVGGGLGTALGVMGKLAGNQRLYRYTVVGRANVDGIVLDPSQTVDVELTLPTTPTNAQTPPTA
jgi:hypothetical protein